MLMLGWVGDKIGNFWWRNIWMAPCIKCNTILNHAWLGRKGIYPLINWLINTQVGWVRHGCNTTQPPLTTSTLRTTQRPTTTLRPTPTTPTNNTVRTTQTNGAGKLDNFAVMSLILMFMAMSFRWKKNKKKFETSNKFQNDFKTVLEL